MPQRKHSPRPKRKVSRKGTEGAALRTSAADRVVLLDWEHLFFPVENPARRLADQLARPIGFWPRQLAEAVRDMIQKWAGWHSEVHTAEQAYATEDFSYFFELPAPDLVTLASKVTHREEVDARKLTKEEQYRDDIMSLDEDIKSKIDVRLFRLKADFCCLRHHQGRTILMGPDQVVDALARLVRRERREIILPAKRLCRYIGIGNRSRSRTVSYTVVRHSKREVIGEKVEATFSVSPLTFKVKAGKWLAGCNIGYCPYPIDITSSPENDEESFEGYQKLYSAIGEVTEQVLDDLDERISVSPANDSIVNSLSEKFEIVIDPASGRLQVGTRKMAFKKNEATWALVVRIASHEMSYRNDLERALPLNSKTRKAIDDGGDPADLLKNLVDAIRRRFAEEFFPIRLVGTLEAGLCFEPPVTARFDRVGAK